MAATITTITTPRIGKIWRQVTRLVERLKDQYPDVVITPQFLPAYSQICPGKGSYKESYKHVDDMLNSEEHRPLVQGLKEMGFPPPDFDDPSVLDQFAEYERRTSISAGAASLCLCIKNKNTGLSQTIHFSVMPKFENFPREFSISVFFACTDNEADKEPIPDGSKLKIIFSANPPKNRQFKTLREAAEQLPHFVQDVSRAINANRGFDI